MLEILRALHLGWQVSHLEQQLLQTKSRWRAESDELHHKIEAQSAELDKALSTCSGLRQTVK